MSLQAATARDQLLLEIVKLEGKLTALQRANVFSLLPEAASPKDRKPSLTHNVSALSTDCPDESTEGMESPSHNESDDGSSMSEDEE
jgi:hypothetical protein